MKYWKGDEFLYIGDECVCLHIYIYKITVQIEGESTEGEIPESYVKIESLSVLNLQKKVNLSSKLAFGGRGGVVFREYHEM